jgi:hypothetical protein
MKHIRQIRIRAVRARARTLGLCLAALFAVAAVGATTASAKSTLPEWGKCELAETHEGLYGNSNCTDQVKPLYGKPAGDWEWHTASGYDFRSGTIGPTTFETTNGKSIHCSGGALEATQAVEAPNRMTKMLVEFHGCESGGRECFEFSNIGNWLEGEWIDGELVYLSGKGTANPTVGLTLTTKVAGQHLFKVVCEGELGSVEIGGLGGKKTEKAKGNAASGVISPIDQMTETYRQTFAQTAGVQEPAPAKGKAESLQMFLSNESRWVQMGLAATFTYFSEEELGPVEIKAVK